MLPATQKKNTKHPGAGSVRSLRASLQRTIQDVQASLNAVDPVLLEMIEREDATGTGRHPVTLLRTRLRELQSDLVNTSDVGPVPAIGWMENLKRRTPGFRGSS